MEVDTPDIDPSNGLVELPAVPVDTQVEQACTPGGSQSQSEFIATGRGGLSPNPGDVLSTDAVMVDLAISKEQQNATLGGQRRRQAEKTTPLIILG